MQAIFALIKISCPETRVCFVSTRCSRPKISTLFVCWFCDVFCRRVRFLSLKVKIKHKVIDSRAGEKTVQEDRRLSRPSFPYELCSGSRLVPNPI